jgi:hypothetical protein
VAQIGVSEELIETLQSQTIAAREAMAAADRHRAEARAATLLYYTTSTAMRDTAATILRAIKAHAALRPTESEGVAVYAAAEIPLPAAPSPPPAPGVPRNIETSVLPDGAVRLSWKAEHAAASDGVYFNISRKLPGERAFRPLTGAAGSTSARRTMTCTDATVPASAAGRGVRYIIQGMRGHQPGEPSPAVVVQFGEETEEGNPGVDRARAVRRAA